MRLFHDSIWTALGRCGFAAALPPYGPSPLRVSALTRGSRYREFGDWPFIHEEMRPARKRDGGTSEQVERAVTGLVAHHDGMGL